jgi:CRISPR system Cascade subunit CasC
MFIELHMIQNFAPSNLNRDDTGSPKDCTFGGYRRARISSQCIKRAIRTHEDFLKYTEATENSIRTNHIFRLFGPYLQKADKSEEEIELVVAAFATAYLGKGASVKNDQANMLLYVGPQERDQIGQLLLDNWDELISGGKVKTAVINQIVKDDIIKQSKGFHAPDIAMFGRMLAGQPSLNIDAACHVAPALSTHRIGMEMDYFTAVDDLQDKDEETGASMIGFKQFNSPCYYRYARIDWKLLVKNLMGDEEAAHRAVTGFIRAMVAAVPSGMQSGSAAYNEPALLMGVVRSDGKQWNLSNAFEQPVHTSNGSGLIQPSIKALDDQWQTVIAFYDDAQIEALSVYIQPKYQTALSENSSFPTHMQTTVSGWVDGIVNVLPQE